MVLANVLCICPCVAFLLCICSLCDYDPTLYCIPTFQALELQYQVNGRRQCDTCLSTSTFLEVLEQLSVPGVRRLVVIEPMTRFVQGIISLRDAVTFLLG
ncbi:hypothetical protein ACQ4PT_061163 [Festuca glaucescens]